jgi:hypothetical protein
LGTLHGVDVETGLMGRLITAPGSVKGITFGETIYPNADAARDFEKRDRESVVLLGHELTHVPWVLLVVG